MKPMNLNKCYRCGCFFASQEDVCPNCKPKDQNECANLSNYLEENGLPESLSALSSNTNISVRNLNRYLKTEQFASYQFNQTQE